MGFTHTVLAAEISDNLVVPFVVFGTLVWFALIWWTRADARRRMRNQSLIGAATALAFIPFAGTIMYMILRPPEYLEDAYEREISIASSEKLIEVLAELQHTQREIHASVRHLEQALHASRRRQAAQQAARAGQAPSAGSN